MQDKSRKITIQDLYPDLSPEEQEAAAENLRQYARLVYRICERLQREGGLEEALRKLRLKEEWKKRFKKRPK